MDIQLLKTGLRFLLLTTIPIIFFVFGIYRGMEIISLLLIMILAILFYPIITAKSIDLFAPVVIFIMAQLRFLLRPIYWLITGDIDCLILSDFMNENELIKLIERGLIYVLLAVTFYVIGYKYKLSETVVAKFPTPSISYNTTRFKFSLLLFIIIGVSSLFILINISGGLYYIFTNLWKHRELFEGKFYLFMGFLFMVIANLIIFGAYGYKYKDSVIRYILLFITSTISIILASIFGSRGGAFSILVIMAIIYNYFIRKVSIAQFGIIVILLIVLSSWFLDIRKSSYEIQRKELKEVTIEERQLDIGYSFKNLATDLIYFDSFMLLIRSVPDELPLRFGSTYLNLLTLPIPRKLWPNKPIYGEDQYIWFHYATPYSLRRGIPFGYIGTMYINFHVVGIILGFFILGLFHNLLYRWLLKFKDSLPVVVIYSITTWWLKGFSNGEILNWLLWMVPILLFLIINKAEWKYNKIIIQDSLTTIKI